LNITALVTLHREGCLAHPTLRSLHHCAEFARSRGYSSELLLVLDSPDAETRRVAHAFAAKHSHVVLCEVEVRDLSLARNAGVQAAHGEWLGTHDGDDLYSTNWLADCAARSEGESRSIILHPELTVVFGQTNWYFWQFDQTDVEHYRPHAMMRVNFWNACSFSRRRVYLENPYQVARVGEAGFGFEDWHWNCETIAAGGVHLVTPRTIRFERRKAVGSLNNAHTAASALIRPSRFFDLLKEE
jgi:glycosyltransferase involved in cell wall biosynthesis